MILPTQRLGLARSSYAISQTRVIHPDFARRTTLLGGEEKKTEVTKFIRYLDARALFR